MKIFSLFTTTFIGGAGTALYFGVSGNKGNDSNRKEPKPGSTENETGKGPETLDVEQQPNPSGGNHQEQEERGGGVAEAPAPPAEPSEEPTTN